MYDKTEQGVVAKHHEIQVALNNRKYIKKSRDTIADIMETMLKDQKEDMKPNSYLRKLNTKNVILKEMSTIVNMPIQKVTSKQINEEFKKLKEIKKSNGDYKYSQSYLNKIFSLLREVFEQAVEDKKVGSEDNPFKTKKGVKKPKSNKKPKDIRILTKNECIALLKELNKRL